MGEIGFTKKKKYIYIYIYSSKCCTCSKEPLETKHKYTVKSQDMEQVWKWYGKDQWESISLIWPFSKETVLICLVSLISFRRKTFAGIPVSWWQLLWMTLGGLSKPSNNMFTLITENESLKTWWLNPCHDLLDCCINIFLLKRKLLMSPLHQSLPDAAFVARKPNGFYLFIFIGGWLLYSTVTFSAIRQHE